ncbi:MAG: phosphoglycerate dehydrogenase [Candidatus Bathyarchaeia archaeon]
MVRDILVPSNWKTRADSEAVTGKPKPKWRVLIGSRSFGRFFPEHIMKLEEMGCEVKRNTIGRAYKEIELIDMVPGVDAIITGTDQLTERVINSADRLKTIVKHGVGLDNIDLKAAKARGIIISSTPDVIKDSVADLTMALILAVARKIIPAHLSVKRGSWKGFLGIELRDKILGIIGLGRIGKAVCERAKSFGMRVIACDPNPDYGFAEAHKVAYLSLEELLETADVISLHAALEEKDSGPIIGARELDKMRDGAIIINTARGYLIDEGALADALRKGKIAGAGLDVFMDEPPTGSPLIGLSNVVLTPHIGGQTFDGIRRMGEITIENCIRGLRGEQPVFRVV